MRLIDADELKQDFEDVIPNEIVENENKGCPANDSCKANWLEWLKGDGNE